MIPIRNIYYLLCYAWDTLEQADLDKVGVAGEHSMANLLAAVLIEGVDDLLRRGLDRDYVEIAEDVVGIRGRLDFAATSSRLLLPFARTHCRHDELTHDVLQNQLIKATLRNLARIEEVDKRHRHALADLWSRMPRVSELRVSPDLFSRVRLHSNNARYRFLLDVCSLVYGSLLVDEAGNAYSFVDFTRERGMERLFERFLLRFYARHLVGKKVRAPRMPWQDVVPTSADTLRLPELKTDIVIQSDDTALVIDAKYYAQPLARDARFGSETVRPEHINQLYAYMTNIARSGRYSEVRGMLLYAAPQDMGELEADYIVHGFRLRVASVDLMVPVADIERRLLHVVA